MEEKLNFEMIRQFEQSDMEQVLKIWLDASIQAHDFIDDEFWISKVPEMRDVYLPSGETFVYDKKGVVLGFASLYENTLAAIFVTPEMQGQGIGRQLMDSAKKMRNELRLTVYKENPQSVSFYDKCGFKRLKEQVDIHTGHPEIVMVWNS